MSCCCVMLQYTVFHAQSDLGHLCVAIYCVFLLFCNVPILGSVLFCVTNKHHPVMRLQAVYITLKQIQGLDVTRANRFLDSQVAVTIETGFTTGNQQCSSIANDGSKQKIMHDLVVKIFDFPKFTPRLSSGLTSAVLACCKVGKI